MAARILIVDDHDVVRQGARAILQTARPEWEICGEATTGREAISAAAKLNPDVVILDISMPQMTGIEAAPAIAKVSPNSRILLFTMHESDALLAEARQIGARGYVQKTQAGRDLVAAVEKLLEGGTFFNPNSKSTPQTEMGTIGRGVSTRGALKIERLNDMVTSVEQGMKADSGTGSFARFVKHLDLPPRGISQRNEVRRLILLYLTFRSFGFRVALVQ